VNPRVLRLLSTDVSQLQALRETNGKAVRSSKPHAIPMIDLNRIELMEPEPSGQQIEIGESVGSEEAR